jgi:hypothetical protein
MPILLGWDETAPREDQDTMPIRGFGILLQVSVDFGEEAVVEGAVFLELDFAEVDGRGGRIPFGNQQTVDTEGRLLDFDRSKVVIDDRGGIVAQQFEEQFRLSLEDFVEERIGFHSRIITRRRLMPHRSNGRVFVSCGGYGSTRTVFEEMCRISLFMAPINRCFVL